MVTKSTPKTKEKLLQKIHELNEKISLFLTFLNSITDGVIIIQDGVIKFTNESIAKMANIPLEEIIDSPYDRFISPNFKDEVRKAYEELTKGKKVPPFELKIQNPYGKTFYIEVEPRMINYQGKQTITTVIRNITQWKKVQEKIREKAIFFESLFENLPEAVALLDKVRHIIKVNKICMKFEEHCRSWALVFLHMFCVCVFVYMYTCVCACICAGAHICMY